MDRPALRRYDAPPTRLPFVNMEIAQTRFQGDPHLVSSIYGGASGGRLVFWNPDTGSRGERLMPDGVPGAYMLRPAPDGRLYLGSGNGDLLRYDPEADRFQTLASGALNGIVWGGCIAGRYVVASANPGHALVYDWQGDRVVKVFRPMDEAAPPALYGHHVCEAPDGKVVVAMNVPVARLVVLDLATMRAQSFHPPSFGDAKYAGPMAFLDAETLLVLVGREEGRMQLLRYPGFGLAGVVEGDGGKACPHGHWAWHGGALYCVHGKGHALHRLDAETRQWAVVSRQWPEDAVSLHGWGRDSVCGVTRDGFAVRLHLPSGRLDRLDLEAWGVLGVHSLCPVPQRGFVAGSPFINARFWTVNLDTGQGRDIGRGQPGGGQVNQIVWDEPTGQLLLASYTTASVMAYDPGKPYDFGANPRLVASAGNQGQMRPMQTLHDGRYAWMATNAKYGTHSGALSRIDPQTGEIIVWKGLAPNQNLLSMALDLPRRRVLLASNIHPDCRSAPPLADTAELLAFDMDRLCVAARHPLPKGTPSAWILAALTDGDALASDGETVWRWSPGRGQLASIRSPLPRLTEAAADASGALWAACPEGIGLLAVEGTEASFDLLLSLPGAKRLAIVGEALYFADAAQVCCVALKDLAHVAP